MRTPNIRWLNSFRFSVMLGAFLWTLGLIPIGHLVFIAVHGRRATLTMIAVGDWSSFAFAAFCLVAGIILIRSGLRPFSRLRQQLSGVRDGSASRIQGAFPSEVQPLVNDLNALLEDRERIVERALAKAGDLAHGLKTPLAVLAQEADRAETTGDEESAATIGQQVERMRRQIEYHLAHARAAGAGNVPGARCAVAPSVEGLVRTLERIYAGRHLRIDVDVSPEHFIRGQREDLDEMLGNLLDNACKWARSCVPVQSIQEGDTIVLIVDDDGPGLDVSMRNAVLQRGVRADEAAPGSGLGLAIVRELVDLYKGTISLEDSPLGGLRALLRLPAPERSEGPL